MRKILLYICLIIIIACGFFMYPTRAADEKFFDYEEIVKELDDFKNKILEQCEGDDECFREKVAEIYTGDRSNIFYRFVSFANFMIPEINIEKNYIKVYFSNFLVTWSGYQAEVFYKDILKHVYIGWFEDNVSLGSLDMIFMEKIEYAGAKHIIYTGKNQVFDNGYSVFELGDEQDLSMNLSNKISFYVAADRWSTKRFLDYSSCINSEEYEKGMTCRLMIGERGTMKYHPVWDRENVKEEEINVPLVSEIEKQDTDNDYNAKEESTNYEVENIISTLYGESANAYNPENNEEMMGEGVVEVAKDIADMEDEIEVPLVGGEDKNVTCHYSEKFPWWLFLLLILGNIVVFWWFWPEKQQKMPKK